MISLCQWYKERHYIFTFQLFLLHILINESRHWVSIIVYLLSLFQIQPRFWHYYITGVLFEWPEALWKHPILVIITFDSPG